MFLQVSVGDISVIVGSLLSGNAVSNVWPEVVGAIGGFLVIVMVAVIVSVSRMYVKSRRERKKFSNQMSSPQRSAVNETGTITIEDAFSLHYILKSHSFAFKWLLSLLSYLFTKYDYCRII